MFGDKGGLARQAALRTIMSTKIIEWTHIKDYMIHMIEVFNEMKILGIDIDEKN